MSSACFYGLFYEIRFIINNFKKFNAFLLTWHVEMRVFNHM